jgi:hypothetical protein
MASKKPAKKNVSNTQEKKAELPGKAVLYYGTPGKEFVCPTCKRQLIKGIIYESNAASYCKRMCIPKPQLEASI